MRLLLALFCGLACSGMLPSTLLAQVVFTPLSDLPGGIVLSRARAISRDGLSVVGAASSTLAPYGEAVLWRGGAVVPLGDLPGGDLRSEAWDVTSAAANAGVVGIGRSSVGEAAFRWSETDEFITALGFISGGELSRARGVSADGTIIVGSAFAFGACRWTGGGEEMELLSGLLAGGAYSSEAWDVSADGTVIVGQGTTSAPPIGNGFRWTETGVTTIPSLPGATFLSPAYGVSADGSVVVGQADTDQGIEAYRWTAAAGTVGLGDLEGGLTRSLARSTNADGSVIVGQGLSATGFEAFVWTVTAGMRPLREVLIEGGAELEGWTLEEAMDVSDDGTRIVGYGTSPDGMTEAWLAELGSAENVAVDHFKAYDVRDTGTKKDLVSLKGQFDEKFQDSKANAITHIATPVRKNGEPLCDPHAHLTFFTLDRSNEPQRQVHLRNQFGEQTVVTREAKWLLVPSEKVEEGSSLSKTLDHYKVYEVNRPKPTTAPKVQLEDQFLTETVDVGPMVFFAVPVEKKHKEVVSTIQHPAVHLAIYSIQGTKNIKEKRPVKNQFGEFELDIFHGRYLCVPSEKLNWNILKE